MNTVSSRSVADIQGHIFRELNDHMRATEQKHLQVSVGYLGAMALALSLLAPSASVNTAHTLFHTWGHLMAYYVMVMAGCATILAQHSYRGWKKHYLVACKRLVARWPLDGIEGLTWLRLDVGPYSHPGPYQTPLRGGFFKVSGDNGLYYFTIAITSSLVVVLLIALITLLGGAIGIVAATVSALCYFTFLFRINIAGIVRKRIVEQEWRDFRLTVLAERGVTSPEGEASQRLTRAIAEDGGRAQIEPSGSISRVDLRNHTHHSPNSSIRADDYVRAHADGAFDVLGITDHNTIRGALELRELADFPVVVGEEIDTLDGPLVGLFLERPLTTGRTALDTAKEIHSQGGLVYLQHSFALPRWRGLKRAAHSELLGAGEVDIVEVRNHKIASQHSRAYVNRAHAISAASNAYYPPDVGRCYVATPGFGALQSTLLPAELLGALERGSPVFNRRLFLSRFASRSHFTVFTALARIAGVPAWSSTVDY